MQVLAFRFTRASARWIRLAALSLTVSATAAQAEILVSPRAADMEIYAARELRRYLHQMRGVCLPVARGRQRGTSTEPLCIVGVLKDWPLLTQLAAEGKIPWTTANPGPQGYVLKSTTIDGRPTLVIAGADAIGCLYGVYGLLEDHFGVSFHLDGDVLPESVPGGAWPEIEEAKTPLVPVRGMLPWSNFFQSPSSYSWEDWKFILDQMARMRMNFICLHNYNGSFGHNEPFHNVELNGMMSRTWLATGRTGYGGHPGWDVNRYLFGATDLFDDYDFGSDCGLHNEKLDNRQVFRKGVAMFQRIIEYAHRRGIQVGLGEELNYFPACYGKAADDPAVIEARARQIATDYPNLDCLVCFTTESIKRDPNGPAMWRRIFDGFYGYLRKHAPSIRFAVSGWGLCPSPRDAKSLPRDVVAAEIAGYSASFDSGASYANREHWGCPWLECDINSSEYYYPYRIHLSDTVESWRARAPNTKGLYCLTWRLTDAIAPKMWFIARAPWDTKHELKDARAVYHEFARRWYGEKAANRITTIINQNEPYAPDNGECGPTLPFAVKTVAGPLFNLRSFKFSGGEGEEWEQAAIDGSECLAGIKDGDCKGYTIPGRGKSHPEWTRFTAKVSSAGAGGKIVIRLGEADGRKVGEVLVPAADPAPGTRSSHQGRVPDAKTWVDVSTTLSLPVLRRYPTIYLVFSNRTADDELLKAETQIKIIDHCIAEAETPAQKYRLGLLRNRIAAAADHIRLCLHFADAPWAHLGKMMESWIRNFSERVTDVSSLGSLASAETRFVQLNYLPQELKLRLPFRSHPPRDVTARGTRDGARITWRNEEPGARGFVVYRGREVATAKPLPPTASEFTDKASGRFDYSVAALRWDDEETPRSLLVTCLAGTADRTPPRIIVISPPTTARAGQPVWVEARLLDNRDYDLLSATLCYRTTGESNWTRLPMTRRVKAIFDAAIPARAVTDAGLEYFVEANDGDNTGVFPVSAPAQSWSMTVEAADKPSLAEEPVALHSRNKALEWPAAPGAFIYRIYRSQGPDFTPGPENLLTYVAAESAPRFEDNGEDFAGRPLQGGWYYRVTAVDRNGCEGRPSPAAFVKW